MSPEAQRIARFMKKVEKGDGCWEWRGALSGSGYGQFWDGDKLIPAHWFLLDVRPGRGFEACHRCDNRLCINPSHIFIGTKSDNMRDMVAKGRQNRPALQRACRKMIAIRRLQLGEANHQAKLSDANVALIKGIPKTRGMGARLARHFKVSETIISGIWNGRRWPQAPPDRQRAEAFLRTLSLWTES